MEDEEIAWVQAQSRGLVSVAVDEAVARRTAGLGVVAFCEIDSEDAVLAPQILRFRNDTAGRRTWAGIPRNLLRAARPVNGGKQQGREQDRFEFERKEHERTKRNVSKDRTEPKHDLNYSPMEAFGSGSQARNNKFIAGWLMEHDWVVNKSSQGTARKKERRA